MFILFNELKLKLPLQCFNVGRNLFKLEIEREDKEEYKKHFEIEEYKKKLYYYKMKINNNKIKPHQAEVILNKQIKGKCIVSRYFYHGVDTGIFFISTTKKILLNQRVIKINSKTYRIECMNNSEIANYNTTWKVKVNDKTKEEENSKVEKIKINNEPKEEEETELKLNKKKQD